MTERDDQYATREEEEWTKKREWVEDLLKSRGSGNPQTQAIRMGLTELIRKAVADKDIGMLAFLAGWFVLVSEDITIDLFETWMEWMKAESPANPMPRLIPSRSGYRD